MRVYGASMSPFVRKVLVACAEKGLEVESKVVGIGSDDEGFRAASPLGKMPALEDGEYRLADSSAIIHYLEAKYPAVPLIPAGPEERGRVIWFEEFADTVLSACGAKIFFNRIVAPMFLQRDGDLGAAERAERDELPPLLAYLDDELGARHFLVGDQLTISDIAIASSLANLEHADVPIDEERYPQLTRYQREITGRPSFKALLDKERGYFARKRS